MEKGQIQPRIAGDVIKKLDEVVSRDGTSRGEVVEAALRSYLWPAEEATKMDTVLQQLSNLTDGQDQIRAMLDDLMTTPPVVEEEEPTPQRWLSNDEILAGYAANDPVFAEGMRQAEAARQRAKEWQPPAPPKRKHPLWIHILFPFKSRRGDL